MNDLVTVRKSKCNSKNNGVIDSVSENNSVSKCNDKINGEINCKIREGIDIVKGELNNDSNLRRKVINKVIEKKVIDEIEYDYDLSGISLSKELEDFIKIQISESTKISYRKRITDFIKWCFIERINILKITRRESESYLLYLGGLFSPNSVRANIIGVSSFYQFLIIRYPKVFCVVNPFHKLKLPKIKQTRKIDVITERDIKELKKEFKRIGRNDIICIIDLLVKYGFRVGIFENMKVDSKGNWESVSKGQELRGKFTQKERDLINETGILNIKKYNVTNIILKYTGKLFKEGKIGSQFSPHDIRHYYITKNGKDLTMEEFIKFSRKIHKNLYTTLEYMNV